MQGVNRNYPNRNYTNGTAGERNQLWRDRDGSFISFAATSAERVQSGDPRKSIAERYGSPEDYLNKVTAAATALLDDRLLLPEDAAAYIERARSAVKSWAFFKPV